MPVRRDDREPDPPSPLPLDRSEDFVQDPESHFNKLPFPYRIINKEVERLFDFAWEAIERVESEKARLASKPVVPEYKCHTIVKSLSGRVTALDGTVDGKYLILVEEDRVCVREGETGDVLAQIEREEKEHGDGDGAHRDHDHCSLSLARCGADCHVIAVSDGRGLHLYMFYMGRLLLLRDIMNQDSIHGVNRCLLSSGGNFLALSSNDDSERYVKFLSLPIASWKTEVDNALQQLETAVTASQESEDEVAQLKVTELKERLCMLHTTLSKPSVVLRVLPEPPPPLSPFASLPSELSDLVLSAITALPTGLKHPLTKTYFELSGQQLEMPEMRLGDCHFLKSIGNSRPTIEDQVAVWWTGCHILYLYTLTHQGKDIDLKPMENFPFTSHISCTSVSPDTRLLAVGQTDGHIVVLDLFTHFALATSHCSANAVTGLVISPAGNCQYNVIVGSSGGELIRIETADMFTTCRVSGPVETHFELDSDEMHSVSRLDICAFMPSLVLVSNVVDHRFLCVHDLSSGHMVCRISLPMQTTLKQYVVTKNGQRIFALGGDYEVYSACPNQWTAIRPYVQEPLLHEEFDPSAMTAERIWSQLIEEDIRKNQNVSMDEWNLNFEKLCEDFKAETDFRMLDQRKQQRSKSRSQRNPRESNEEGSSSGISDAQMREIFEATAAKDFERIKQQRDIRSKNQSGKGESAF